MGQLVGGVWREGWNDTSKTGGRFVRAQASFRGAVTRGRSGQYPAQVGRYHLYVSPACPWAHRTMIVRALKGLEVHLTVSRVGYVEGGQGWTFDPSDDRRPPVDSTASYLHETYARSDCTFTGPVTVPVLLDKNSGRIVSNESSDIVRMMNYAFNDLGAKPVDYYPPEFRQEINQINAIIYDNVNNGVYQAGFATSQEAYEEAVWRLFETLDLLEARLKGRDWLVGDMLTEADIRLFPTLVRFDLVYYGLFKCNHRPLSSYPNLSGLARRILALPGVQATVDADQIRRQYHLVNRSVNPSGIVPVGPPFAFS